MHGFQATLVREKIIFRNEDGSLPDNPDSAIIRSNRILLNLEQANITERIVVRAQTMHAALYVAGKIVYSFFRNGFFLDRPIPYDWEGMWDSTLSSYEKEFNPQVWSAIYINGKPVFRTIKSPFVDIVEACALLTADNYDATMAVAETAFKKAGKAMLVDQSSNVAAVFTDSGDMMRCGIIHRADGHDTVLNITAEGSEPENRIYQTINFAGELLEGMNLGRLIERIKRSARSGTSGQDAVEPRKQRLATMRLTTLDHAVSSFESVYRVKYRPEKPVFFRVT